MLPCDASNDGCTSLRRAVAGQPALNLIQNGSFESATGTPVIPDGWKNANSSWSYTAPAPDPSTGSPAADGAQSLYPPVAASPRDARPDGHEPAPAAPVRALGLRAALREPAG